MNIIDYYPAEIEEINIRKPWKNICGYAYKGCEKAKDGETFENYCSKNGEDCFVNMILTERI